MLEKDKNIGELYDLKHIHDNKSYTSYDYENNLFRNTLSNVLFKNEQLSEYLIELQKLAVCSIESNLILENLWNFGVSKYYKK